VIGRDGVSRVSFACAAVPRSGLALGDGEAEAPRISPDKDCAGFQCAIPARVVVMLSHAGVSRE